MNRRAAMCVAGALALTAGGSVTADTVSLGASKDNTLYEDPEGLISNGAGRRLLRRAKRPGRPPARPGRVRRRFGGDPGGIDHRERHAAAVHVAHVGGHAHRDAAPPARRLGRGRVGRAGRGRRRRRRRARRRDLDPHVLPLVALGRRRRRLRQPAPARAPRSTRKAPTRGRPRRWRRTSRRGSTIRRRTSAGSSSATKPRRGPPSASTRARRPATAAGRGSRSSSRRRPTSARCCIDDTCQLLNAEACAKADGVFQGAGTSCDANPCERPPGRAASRTGTARSRRRATAQSGGTYQGDGTVCDPNPCPQPTGACCAADGTCTDRDARRLRGRRRRLPGRRHDLHGRPLPDRARAVRRSAADAGRRGAGHRRARRRRRRTTSRCRSSSSSCTATCRRRPSGATTARSPARRSRRAAGEPVTVNWINDLRDETGQPAHRPPTCPSTCACTARNTLATRAPSSTCTAATSRRRSTATPRTRSCPASRPDLRLSEQPAGRDALVSTTTRWASRGSTSTWAWPASTSSATTSRTRSTCPRASTRSRWSIQDRTFNPDGSLALSRRTGRTFLRRQDPGQRQGLALPRRGAGQVPLPAAQRIGLARLHARRSSNGADVLR